MSLVVFNPRRLPDLADFVGVSWESYFEDLTYDLCIMNACHFGTITPYGNVQVPDPADLVNRSLESSKENIR